MIRSQPLDLPAANQVGPRISHMRNRGFVVAEKRHEQRRRHAPLMLGRLENSGRARIEYLAN
jgi:hypothetical protein